MPGTLLTNSKRGEDSRQSKSKPDLQWTFSLFGGCESDSSDSSDLEDEEPRATNSNSNIKSDASYSNEGETANIGLTIETEDVRLIRELDIASRAEKDTAQFRANPWSIARVNAASRKNAPSPSGLGSNLASGHNDCNHAENGTFVRVVKPVDGGDWSRARSAIRTSGSKEDTPKTIENYFTAGKISQGNQQLKATKVSVDSKRIQSSPHTTRKISHQPVNAAILQKPDASRSPSTSRAAWPIVHAGGHSSPQTQATLTTGQEHVSPTLVDANIHRATQSSQESPLALAPANSTRFNSSYAADSFDYGILDHSHIHTEGTKGFTHDIPSADLTATELVYSDCPDAEYELYAPEEANPIYADKFLADDDTRTGLPSPAERIYSTKSFLRPVSSLTRPLQRPFSSPPRPGSNTSRARPTITDTFSSTIPTHMKQEMADAPLNVNDKYQSSQCRGQLMQPSTHRSYSSPIRQQIRSVHSSGRVALGLEPPKPQPSDWTIDSHRLKRSTRPDASLGDAQLLPQRDELITRHGDDAPGRNHIPNHHHFVKAESADLEFDDLVEPGECKPAPGHSSPSTYQHHSSRSPPSRHAHSIHPTDANRPRPKEVTSTHKADVYSTFANQDEEDTWTTLPQRKKARTHQVPSSSTREVEKAKSMKQSGRFKLPIALPSLAAKTVTNEPTSMGRKRVITYLPPPRNAQAQTSGTMNAQSDKTTAPTTRGNDPKARVGTPKVNKPASQWSIKRLGFSKGIPAAPSSDLKLNLLHGQINTKAEQPDDESYLLKDGQAQYSELKSSPDDGTGMLSSDTSASYKTPDEGDSSDMDFDVTFAFEVEAIQRSYPKARQAMLE